MAGGQSQTQSSTNFESITVSDSTQTEKFADISTDHDLLKVSVERDVREDQMSRDLSLQQKDFFGPRLKQPLPIYFDDITKKYIGMPLFGHHFGDMKSFLHVLDESVSSDMPSQDLKIVSIVQLTGAGKTKLAYSLADGGERTVILLTFTQEVCEALFLELRVLKKVFFTGTA